MDITHQPSDILVTVHNISNYSGASHLTNGSTSSVPFYFIFSAGNADLNYFIVITKQHLGYYMEFISGIKTKLRALYGIFINGILITITKIVTNLQSPGLKCLLSFKRYLINHKSYNGQRELSEKFKMIYLKSCKT